ncbi:hypothetical protein ABTY61_02175 [Kitasatospora sp. NPDC096128]|uniref:hypothetical protein n=1 Tax=Kitasatospora sp. NPDC096128 TaxID=3155547 RepID=UPI00332E5CB1
MASPIPGTDSPVPGRRRAAGLAGFAGLVLTVGLTLTGCDPSAADAKPTSSPTSSPTVAAVPSAATPSAAGPTVPAPPAVTPVAPPTASAPPPSAPPPSAPPTVHPQTPAAKPQPKVTTAQPPTDPQSQHTQAAGGSQCEIRSNAGNCYAAGQFCRNDDLGRSTHDEGGRVIYCRMVSGKPHWQA